jgi:hypothetical protein
VLQEIPALTQIALVNGQVTDARIESQLAGSRIVLIGKVKKESMAVSRPRECGDKEEEAQEVKEKQSCLRSNSRRKKLRQQKR